MLLGAHLSVAGGAEKAVERAVKLGFPTLAIFVRNPLRWRGPPLTDEAAARFRRACRRGGISPVVAHGSYLVNLAAGADLRRRSMAAAAEELDRCGRLGVGLYVLHPGSPGRTGRREGIARVADALNGLMDGCRHRRVCLLLETTAGAGRQLAGSFEDLAEILSRVVRVRRFGVCLDTCHVFAAGYDLRTPEACRRTLARFDRLVGLDRLRCIHLSDSAAALGSRRDRHAHIGRGRIGRRGFASFVNDPRLPRVPMILETPKETTAAGRDSDQVNAETLRALRRKP